MFTVQELLFELSYSFLKVLHHIRGLEERKKEDISIRLKLVEKFGILYELKIYLAGWWGKEGQCAMCKMDLSGRQSMLLM